MIHILGFIFIIIIAVLLIGLSLISLFLRSLFGLGKRVAQTDVHTTQTANRKKLFDRNEGEYVEFEEVK